MKRLTGLSLRLLLVVALLLPAGCVSTLAGMVVKHVAMSAAKDVAKSQYDEYKRKKADEKAAQAAQAGRERSSHRDDNHPDEASDADSRTNADR